MARSHWLNSKDKVRGNPKRKVRGSEIRLERLGGTELGCGALVGSGATAGPKFIGLSRKQILFTVAQITQAGL